MDESRQCCRHFCDRVATHKVVNARGRSSIFCEQHKDEIMELHNLHPARFLLSTERIDGGVEFLTVI